MKRFSIIFLIIALLISGCTITKESETNIDSNAVVVSDSTNMDSTKLESVSVDSSKDYSQLFSDGEIHKIEISIDEESWNEILANPLEEEFYSADITLDGITVTNVGIRTKGNSTLRDVASSDTDRYSFKFKINEYEDQKLLGLDEFVINNMFSDASYMREYLSYESLEDIGAVVPMSTYTNVYLNGELIGFYLMVETVDDSFLKRNFGDNNGNLYRMDQGSSLSINGDGFNENANQKNGDDESKEDLYELLEILNAMAEGEKGDIETVLDIDSVLKYIAANTFLESYDSLSGQFSQNYYLYNDNGIFTLIPWDYNMSFGTFGGSGVSSVDIDEPVLGITMDQVPLIDNLLAVAEYKERYYEILEEFMDLYVDIEEQVAELKVLIGESVYNDPTRFSSTEDFESSTVYQENGQVEPNLMSNMGGGMRGQDRTRLQNSITPEEGIGIQDGKIPPAPNDNGVKPEGSRMPNGMTPGQRPENEGNDTKAGNGVSIINIINARIDNIKMQLEEKM